VFLVDTLADKRDRGLGVVGVGGRHVQVVNEVKQRDVTAGERFEGLTLLLEHTFELQLQADAVRVKVEVDGLVGLLVFR
jgi:hypothetical protein